MFNYTCIQKDDIKNIDSAYIKMTDSNTDSGLEVYSYNDCTSESPDFVKRCRGVVFNGDNLLVKTFDYTPEYTENCVEEIQSMIENFDDCVFFDSLEGTLVRLFNYGGVWYLSTQKKLDAFKSRWGSKFSFGQLFEYGLVRESQQNDAFKSRLNLQEGEDVYQKFLTTLDVTKVYIFFIRNNGFNRIVCQSGPETRVFHIGTFTDNCQSFCIDDNLDIPYPTILSYSTLESLLEDVKGFNPLNRQGVMVFQKNGMHFKVINSEYVRLSKLRGNDPSVARRYLSLRNTPDINDFKNLYPEFGLTFSQIEVNLESLSKYIYRSYVKRFINKEFSQVTPAEYQIVKECHGWHLEDREHNKIHFEKVREIVNRHNPANLYRILSTLNQTA